MAIRPSRWLPAADMHQYGQLLAELHYTSHVPLDGLLVHA
jgi:hypothetical protein